MEYAEMVELAERYGLRCDAAKSYLLADDYAFLRCLARGANRYAFNVVSGSYQQNEVLIFDYHFEIAENDRESLDEKNHFFLTAVMLLVPAYFPELQIVPEGLLAKIGEALGGQDIEFESAEFSDAFCVRSRDKRFAYDVCNAQVIDFLLDHRDLNIQIQNCVLALVSEAQLPAKQVEENLQLLLEFRSRLPDYLFTKV
jgi:hypothetical protein